MAYFLKISKFPKLPTPPPLFNQKHLLGASFRLFGALFIRLFRPNRTEFNLLFSSSSTVAFHRRSARPDANCPAPASLRHFPRQTNIFFWFQPEPGAGVRQAFRRLQCRLCSLPRTLRLASPWLRSLGNLGTQTDDPLQSCQPGRDRPACRYSLKELVSQESRLVEGGSNGHSHVVCFCAGRECTSERANCR